MANIFGQKPSQISEATKTSLRSSLGLTKATANTKGFKISIVDDDGDIAFLTNIKPLLDARSLKCDLAINIGSVDIGNNARLTSAQLLTLQSAGFGILNHSYIHEDPQTLSTAQIDANAVLEKTKFNALGFPTAFDYFVFPGIMTTGNLSLKNYLKSIYKCNLCNSTAFQNTYPFDSMELKRIGLPTEINTYNAVKSYLDDGSSRNEWCILFTHSYNLTDPTYLNTLLDYIVAKGWIITPVKTVIDGFRNVIELGNKNGSHYFVDQNGNVETGINRMKIIYTEVDTSQYTIKQYEPGTITYTLLTYSPGRLNMPTNYVDVGILTTIRFNESGGSILAQDWFAHQEFRKINTAVIYKRYWNYSTLAWSAGAAE